MFLIPVLILILFLFPFLSLFMILFLYPFLQDFGFLDPDQNPQKYANPRIRIQGVKYQTKKLQKKPFLLLKPKSKLLKKERL